MSDKVVGSVVLEDDNPITPDETPVHSIFPNEEARKAFLDYVEQETKLAEAERSEKLENVAEYRRTRVGIPKQKTKNYPWKDASNVCTPLTDINAKTLFGALKTTFSLKPFWRVKPINQEDDIEEQKAALREKYLNLLAESRNDLDLKKKNKYLLYDAGSLGTAFVKVLWERRPRIFKRRNASGLTEIIERFQHDGPSLLSIQYEDCLYREGWDEIQVMPWIRHTSHVPWHVITQRERMGIYNPGTSEALEEWARTNPLKFEEENAALAGGQILENRVWDIHEYYVYWDVEDDGVYADVKITLELNSGTFLREEYNELGWRPIVPFIYMHQPGTIEGRGVCQMTYHMQMEADTLHNARIDGTHLAAVKMFAMRRHSGGKQREEVRPGKIWMLDNPKEDLVPVQSGEVYPSSLQAEQLDFQMAMRNVGMPEIQGGFADSTLKSRDSAQSQVLRLRQSSGVFQAVAEGLEDSFAEVGMLVWMELCRNREAVLTHERSIRRLSEKELLLLPDCLDMPVEDIPLKMAFTVNTTDVDETYEMERQRYLMLIQTYNMYIGLSGQLMQTITQIAMQLPKMPQLQDLFDHNVKVYAGLSKIMSKILEFGGEPDTKEYMPNYEKLEQLVDFRNQMLEQIQSIGGLNGRRLLGAGPGAMGAGPGVPQGAIGQPGMGNVQGAGPGLPGNPMGQAPGIGG
jgi:hypothetical protein